MSIIGFTEFFAIHKSVAGTTYQYFPSAAIEMVGYLSMTLIASFLLRMWEKKMDGPGSYKLGERLYLEQAERFEWPDLSADPTGTTFCQGLRDQVGVLVDGTVVPCCLDHEGDIPLGNLLEQELEEILSSPRAKAIYDGFSRRQPPEELCRRCGYASRF